MTNGTTYIYRSTGQYFGFINNNNLFQWNGTFLGWVEGKFVWDRTGQYRGELTEVEGNKYILKYIFSVSPVPRAPIAPPSPPAPPAPVANVAPIQLSAGFVDGF